MKKRLALVFLLVLFGGSFAGVPFQFADNQCGLGGAMNMDCCKAALLKKKTLEAADLQLACALNCAQSGATSPPNIVRIPPHSAARVTSRPAIAPALKTSTFLSRRIDRLHGPPGSSPAYLRNLALLI